MANQVDSNLRKQFQALQEQQQQKMLKRKQRQDSKTKESKENGQELNSSQNGFGVNDDMGLKLSDPMPRESVFSEELNSHLNNQIRELKDETGRLYKLLSERDYEIRKLKKKRDEDKQALSGMSPGVASDTAATKIVDLSKRNRELSAELESEKSKVKQLLLKVRDAEKKASDASRNGPSKPARPKQQYEVEAEEMQQELKATQEKLKDASSKLNDFRNQVATLKQDLKVAHKVLSKEVGDNVNVQSLLNENSNWRGRSQQILLLQKKVADLQSQLHQSRNLRPGTEMSLEDQFMTMDLPDDGASTVMTASSSFRKTATIDDRQKNRIRQMERDRREAKDKTDNELRALEEDHRKLKEKFEASKARNKVLANDLKSHKERLSTMVDKGKHDNELIEALLKQQEHLKKLMVENSKKQENFKSEQNKLTVEMNAKTQQEANIVDQLKQIVAEKERKVHQLESELIEAQRSKLRSSLGYGDQTVPSEGRSPSQQGHTSSKDIRPSTQTGRPLSRHGRPQSQQGRPSSQQGFSLSDPPSVSMTQVHQSTGNETSPNIINVPTPPSRNSHRSLSRHNLRPISRDSLQSAEDMTKNASRASGRPASTGSLMSDRMSSGHSEDIFRQFQEYKSLLQVAEVERDKVMELVKVLQQRVDEANEKVAEANKTAADFRQWNVHLEKQLARLRCDNSKGGNKGKKPTEGKVMIGALSTGEELLKDNLMVSQENLDELQTRLAIQLDENQALKAALQSTIKAKEEDLRLYHQLMNQTKQVFLQGLRQYRQTNPSQC